MKPLTQEQRVKVAEYCYPTQKHCKWGIFAGDIVLMAIDESYIETPSVAWQPNIDSNQWKRLITKLAETVKDYNCAFVNTTNWMNKQGQILKAIATNDINAIEALCFELIGESL